MSDYINRTELLRIINHLENFNNVNCPAWVLSVIGNMTAIEAKDTEMEYWTDSETDDRK